MGITPQIQVEIQMNMYNAKQKLNNFLYTTKQKLIKVKKALHRAMSFFLFAFAVTGNAVLVALGLFTFLPH